MEEEKLLDCVLYTKDREHDGKTYTNLYVVIDGHKFEVVPRWFTIKEKSFFYSLVAKCDLPKM